MAQTKTKLTQAQMLEDLYKNAKMGASSTIDLLGRVNDDALRREMTAQVESFEGYATRISKLMERAGITPKEENPLTRMGAKIGMVMNTVSDSSSEHIAEMMIQGVTMGITDLYRLIGEARESGLGSEALGLAEEMLQFEEDASERLKKYL